MAWRMFVHSFQLLFNNLGYALRVSVGPFLLAGVFAAVAFGIVGFEYATMDPATINENTPPSAALATLLVSLALMFAGAWTAVAWHRFILLEEFPGLMPAMPGNRIPAYAGRWFLLGLLLMVVVFPVGAILAQIAHGLGVSAIPGGRLLVAFAVSTLLFYVWLRIAIVLPATAVGRSLTLSQGWNHGGKLSKEILQLAAIAMAVNMPVLVLVEVLPLPMILANLLWLAVMWVSLMVGTSLLTTLYGHLVEGRPLP